MLLLPTDFVWMRIYSLFVPLSAEPTTSHSHLYKYNQVKWVKFKVLPLTKHISIRIHAYVFGRVFNISTPESLPFSGAIQSTFFLPHFLVSLSHIGKGARSNIDIVRYISISHIIIARCNCALLQNVRDKVKWNWMNKVVGTSCTYYAAL